MKLVLKRSSDCLFDLFIVNKGRFIEKIGTIRNNVGFNVVVSVDFLKFKEYIHYGLFIDNVLKARLKYLLILLKYE